MLEKSKLLIDYFEAIVREHPEYIALRLEDGRSYSYEKLDKISTELARVVAFAIYLQSLATDNNVSSSDEGGTETPLVSVMMSRNLSVIASILAILKCGAAYVPVDPTFPPDRQAYIFSQSNCPLLLTDKDSYAQGRCIMRCTM